MPEVVFIPADGGEPITVDSPDGGLLGDLCDEVGADVPFSCRSATCGTCRVVVLEGATLLLPPEADEVVVLELFASAVADAPPQRLACQAKIRAVPGRVVIRPVADDES
jgi:ferredoxin